MVVPWSDDPPGSSGQIFSNVRSLLKDLAADSAKRKPPTVAAAQEWHRKLYDGVTLPVPYFAGEIRDSDPRFPELDGYEVRVGPLRGVPAALVPQELADFEANARRATARLDGVLATSDKLRRASELQAVVNLCALLHGEWVRIHPFASGNGRIARVWANWLRCVTGCRRSSWSSHGPTGTLTRWRVTQACGASTRSPRRSSTRC
jgi:fido (protein-threonine AMPylation protein)